MVFASVKGWTSNGLNSFLLIRGLLSKLGAKVLAMFRLGILWSLGCWSGFWLEWRLLPSFQGAVLVYEAQIAGLASGGVGGFSLC